MKHWRYFSYLMRHKFFVLMAAPKMLCSPWSHPGLYWRLIVHDWSKFLPSEWIPYADSFYGGHEWEERPPELRDAFDRAWLLHIHRNDHHYQHHVLREDSGATKLLEMSDDAVLEMLCDWAGAGRAINGRWELSEWYGKNYEVIKLAPASRRVVNGFIQRFWSGVDGPGS